MRNAIVDQILMERMNRRGGYDGRDYARGDYGRGGYDGRRGRDYGRDYARGGRDGRDGNYDEERFEDEDEKYLMEMQDGRRGVKGTGRGRRRGRRRDYGETLSLTKSDISMKYKNYRVIIRIKAHLTSSIYGKIEDTWDCSDYFVDCFWLVQ